MWKDLICCTLFALRTFGFYVVQVSLTDKLRKTPASRLSLVNLTQICCPALRTPERGWVFSLARLWPVCSERGSLMGSPKGWNIIKKGSRADYERSHHTDWQPHKKKKLTVLNTHPWSTINSYFWITEILRRGKKEQTEAKASIVGFEKGWGALKRLGCPSLADKRRNSWEGLDLPLWPACSWSPNHKLYTTQSLSQTAGKPPSPLLILGQADSFHKNSWLLTALLPCAAYSRITSVTK